MKSHYYQNRYSFSKSRFKVWKAICEYINNHIPFESTVLEIGAGYCDFINNIQAKNKIAIDIDVSAKQHCNEGITFLNINVLDIEFESESLDVVFASNLFEHLSNTELDLLLTKIFNSLTTHGKLILIQPNYYYAFREYWDDYTHVKAFSHHSLSDFITSKGFEIVKLEKKFIPFSFKSRLPKSYLLTKLYLNFSWRPFAKQMLIIAEKKSHVQ